MNQAFSHTRKLAFLRKIDMLFLNIAIFSTEKTMVNKKITEMDMMSTFFGREYLLKPLFIEGVQTEVFVPTNGRKVDALVSTKLLDSDDIFNFVVEMKSSSTPFVIKQAIAQARSYVGFTDKAVPMIVVPYLSPERLEMLEAEGVSGVDLCGNGYINVPNRIYILRTGQRNLYPSSRPLNNPYWGRSAMIGRLFLVRNNFKTLSELWKVLKDYGEALAISQVSKAVQALTDDLVVSKSEGKLSLFDPDKLLNKLAFNWGEKGGRFALRKSSGFKLKNGLSSLSILSKDSSLQWTITGESSVQRYTPFSQGGPKKVVVSNVINSLKLLIDEDNEVEPVDSFADVIIYGTNEPGFFFGKETDSSGVNWAGMVQTYIELANGDARQLEAAAKIKSKILKEFKR